MQTESQAISPIRPPRRVLLGPGPSDTPPSVLQALGLPTLGHLDPEYLRIMDEIGQMLRRLFRTDNRLTLAVPGTGSAGMETCVSNLVEPGDEVIIGVIGYFGQRMREMAERYGAVVRSIEVPWGETIAPEQVREALERHPNTKVVGLVHAETSTGAHQPLTEISQLVHAAGAFFLVDAVTSMGGLELAVDDWGIDACYSGTQKCVGCPPGLAPVTFSERAVESILGRRSKNSCWYLDVSLLANYWGGSRSYHHTAPINMTYGLHEALRLVLEEGIEARIERHGRHHRALRAGLEALGLSYIPQRSLTTLNAVSVPDGVDDARVRRRLLERYGIEIGAGLGPFAGKAWRIGLMGESSRLRNVLMVLSALETLLAEEGCAVPRGEALAAAGTC